MKADMKKMVMPIIAVLFYMVGITFLYSPVYAEESPLTNREKMLLKRVEQLEQRVAELEQRYNTPSQKPQTDPSLDHRVSSIEQTLQEQDERTANDLRTYWKDGLRFESQDGDFNLKISGYLMHDWAWFSQDSDNKRAFGNQRDGTGTRRAKLDFSGTLHGRWFYKIQPDFEDESAGLSSVYMGVSGLPHVGSARIGRFKEPFSLERLTSSRYSTFMERASLTELAPGRNSGFGFNNYTLDERMTWALGLFQTTGTGDGHYGVTSRVTTLPWYAAEDKLLHLGAAFSYRNVDDLQSYSATPGANLADAFVDTGEFDVENVILFGGELAMVNGPFSLQGEYVLVDVDDGASSPQFSSWYVFGSYFLTGEHRPYSRRTGTFRRVRPKSSFLDGKGGTGAWEIAARYSAIDLSDGDISGGEENDITVGLNWYLNPNVRWMWNYVHANVKGAGNADIFQSRFQIDF